MQTILAPAFEHSPKALQAQSILKQCVHCGFCTATCPTYQLLGDELDGPRGRIYLIKEVLEGAKPTEKTQMHLDRCLTCRNCESTCPSGVDYHHLLDIGREIVDEAVPRPLHKRALRTLLKHGLVSPWFDRLYRLGLLFRPLMPKVLQDKVQVPLASGATPSRTHTRQVLLLEGCVQNTMMPNVASATARVLDAMGIQSVYAPQAGCCGALAWHLSDGDMAKAQMRNNIDAWWPFIERTNPIEAIVMNASGCGVMVHDYGHVLQDDPLYKDKAKRVSELCLDLSVYLNQQLESIPSVIDAELAKSLGAVVFHPPCTLQHGQQIKGVVESLLTRLGFELCAPPKDAHLCCGSAGTYSVLQQALSSSLKARKISHLENTGAGLILSANVGCISHLQSATPKPVLHWIEALDRVMKSAH